MSTTGVNDPIIIKIDRGHGTYRGSHRHKTFAQIFFLTIFLNNIAPFQVDMTTLLYKTNLTIPIALDTLLISITLCRRLNILTCIFLLFSLLWFLLLDNRTSPSLHYIEHPAICQAKDSCEVRRFSKFTKDGCLSHP